MTNGSITCAATATLALLLTTLLSADEPAVRTLEILSPVFTVDQEYRSMRGPSDTQHVRFPEAESKELLWITGYRAVMVGADGRTPASQEYMCHSNLDFDAHQHAQRFDLPLYQTGRMFTLSQGQLEIDLPEGFGLPYFADEPLSLTAQVLNLNPDDRTHEVRHKISIEYVAESDLTTPIKPLFLTSGWGMVLLEGETGHYEVSDPDAETHGPGCLPGETAGRDTYTDSNGRRFSGHWVVKSGRETNRTLVTPLLNLPYDTTVHYIAVHLHPFAESLELVDLTTGQSVFKSNTENSEGKIGLDRVEAFSSKKGISVFADHQYELISVYDNTTDEDQDSMAVMLLYMLDLAFEMPRPSAPLDLP